MAIGCWGWRRCPLTSISSRCEPQIGIAKIVGQIKGYTAHALREEFPWLKKCLPSVWTRLKLISSVGAVTLEVVQRYIETQKGV